MTDAHDAVVLLDGDPALLHLGEDKFLERVQSYLELSPALRERVHDIDYVDLRFDRASTCGRRRRAAAQPAGGRHAPDEKRQF